ncbi:MAG: class I SAM-dependent methyltransferase [Rhodospirillales bacterium]|nr:class I SAM-dependent methyltransferase [Rhodospirillales bacterium]
MRGLHEQAGRWEAKLSTGGAVLRAWLKRLRGDTFVRERTDALAAQLEILRNQLDWSGIAIRPNLDADWRRVLLEPPFDAVTFAALALQTVLRHYTFDTVLDIGSGSGEHTRLFLEHGKAVTALDYGRSGYAARRPPGLSTITAEFNSHDFQGAQFDCVWASHVLEHQPNANRFLGKVFAVARDAGVVCVTVPPMKHQIVGGHVSVWNAGLLLYNMVLAGFDCREAAVCSIGYDVSVIVRKQPAELPSLAYDAGDIALLSRFLPPGFAEGQDGRIRARGWPGIADEPRVK